MNHLSRSLVLVAMCIMEGTAVAAEATSSRVQLENELRFESEEAAPLSGWRAGGANVQLTDEHVKDGRYAARVSHSSSAFGGIMKSIDRDFVGDTLAIRGWIRADAGEIPVVWLRSDGIDAPVDYANSAGQCLPKPAVWTQCQAVVPIKSGAIRFAFGVGLNGSGTIWADGFEVLVDGKAIGTVAVTPRARSALELDREFDKGSGVDLTSLSETQVRNLALLGKVWGFLKYHHPAVTSGQRHWDYDLLRVLPVVIGAATEAEADAAITRWVQQLPPVTSCANCVADLPRSDLHLAPSIGWIHSRRFLGAKLQAALENIHANRTGHQFYVSINEGAGNATFANELTYQSRTFPDAGFQLLALFRFWNIIEYWFPYKDVIGTNWDAVLASHIRPIALAADPEQYQLALLQLIATVNDAHANARFPASPPRGQCSLPVALRMVQDRPIVVADLSAEKSALESGDLVVSVDGARVSVLAESILPFITASNQASRDVAISRALTLGECANARLVVDRDGVEHQLQVLRIPVQTLKAARLYSHDRPGETFQLLSDKVGYLKLSSIRGADIPQILRAAAATHGLIVDIRNYPGDFVSFLLGSRLIQEATAFVRFTKPDIGNPGAFRWEAPTMIEPKEPSYRGNVIVLVDEMSISQSEYTAMALRAAPRVKVFGSMTAGADGNVSPIVLPGNFRTGISAIGVFYPNRKPTQRIGIVPDKIIEPTIAGIRAGRDEVLEAALEALSTNESESVP